MTEENRKPLSREQLLALRQYQWVLVKRLTRSALTTTTQAMPLKDDLDEVGRNLCLALDDPDLRVLSPV